MFNVNCIRQNKNKEVFQLGSAAVQILWDNQLEEDVKVARLQEINALVERCARERNARYTGRIEEILAEGINPKDRSQLMGRTRTNRLTFFSSEGPDGVRYSAGDLVKVTIDVVRSFSLSGTPLPKH